MLINRKNTADQLQRTVVQHAINVQNIIVDWLARIGPKHMIDWLTRTRLHNTIIRI